MRHDVWVYQALHHAGGSWHGLGSGVAMGLSVLLGAVGAMSLISVVRGIRIKRRVSPVSGSLREAVLCWAEGDAIYEDQRALDKTPAQALGPGRGQLLCR